MAKSQPKIGFVAFMVVGIFLVWMWEKTCGSRHDQTTSQVKSESIQTQSNTEPKGSKNSENEELQAGSSVVRIGDLADDAFPILSPFKIGTTESNTDPDNPTSLATKHHYRIDGNAYTVEFRRREDPGPYRVFAIYRETSDAAQGTPKSSGITNSSPSSEQSTSPSSSSSTSAVESLSANWLLAKQLNRHKEVMKLFHEATQKVDVEACKRILVVRSAELAQVIREVNIGSYSTSDKQKLLVPLQQEKDWADRSIVTISQSQ